MSTTVIDLDAPHPDDHPRSSVDVVPAPIPHVEELDDAFGPIATGPAAPIEHDGAGDVVGTHADRSGIDGARVIDLVVGLPLLIIALPIIAVLALAIWLSDRGPVFFSQKRIGRSGEHFGCLKLRTMAPDSEDRLEALLQERPELRAEFLATRKLADDPRITRLGRFLRPLGIDELPQLINVVRGEMSLVGPRPRAVSEFEICGSAPVGILAVRPGLTGPWQVAGRNHISDAERVRIELDYAANRTWWVDLKILAETMFLLVTLRLRSGGC